MKIQLHSDDQLVLPIKEVCDRLAHACEVLEFYPGKSAVRMPGPVVKYPLTYKVLDAELQSENKNGDYELVLLATDAPYDNNYFFEAEGRIVVLSFAGWERLTPLPRENGVAYFIATLVAQANGIGELHEDVTGCVNDFLWDKTGIDVGMRAAYICGRCLAHARTNNDLTAVTGDVRNILDVVAAASRMDQSILEAASLQEAEKKTFDVFLCHNSADKPAVRAINQRLCDAGVRTWLDEDQLPLGKPWQAELENAISGVASALVFVGANGTGPWQDPEIRAFLNEFVNRGCPVIPLLLPGSGAEPELPLFLRQMTWVDFREGDKDFGKLATYIKGLQLP